MRSRRRWANYSKYFVEKLENGKLPGDLHVDGE
jgi:hypothetical protein